MSKSNDKSLELLHELITTATQIGPNNTKAILQSARANVEEYQKLKSEAIQNFIITKVCDHFEISRQELIFGSSHGPRTNALRIAFVICARTLKLSSSEIADIFKKDRGNVSRDIAKYNRFKQEIKEEKMQTDFCENCIKETKEFMNSLETAD